MVNKYKHAFSIPEVIVSILVIIIFTVITLPWIMKHKVEMSLDSSVINGTYACYYSCTSDEDCTLVESVYDGKVEKYKKILADGESCSYKPSLRTNKIYIIAVGPGSAKHAGQLVTTLNTPSSFDIKAGKFSFISDKNDDAAFNNASTRVGDAIIAFGGQLYDNGLQIQNLDEHSSCRLVSAPNSCSESCGEVGFVSKSAKPNGCFIEKDIKSENYLVKIEGCQCGSSQKDDSSYLDKNSFKLTSLIRSANYTDRLDKTKIDNLRQAKINNTYYAKDLSGKEYIFEFMFKDSNYDIRNNSSSHKDSSHMSEILENMLPKRKNLLIKDIIDSKPGAPRKNGAVVILW